MRISDEVRKCVVFFGIEVKTEASSKIDYRGTGFIVSVPNETRPGSFFPYLVTAKHVIAEINGRDFYVRANKKDGHAAIFKINSDFRWWFHPKEDESSDVAVMHLGIPQDVSNLIDWVMIPLELLMTDEISQKEQIGAGDEVFIVGLFSYLTGSNKNIPIIRMGNIAMMPDEPVQTKTFGNMEAYLIEARSTGGMSGSPVFVAKDVEFGQKRLHLLGLIHGHWDINADKIIEATTTDAGKNTGINVGIAIVAPAKKILETILRVELAQTREYLSKKLAAKNSPPEMSPPEKS